MGVPHLLTMREFLKQNKEKAFLRSTLRDTLKQNHKMVKQNLDYLMHVEKIVIRTIRNDLEWYQWKE